MAYELFDELSTMSLEEIYEEDLIKIKNDIETELKNRRRTKQFLAIQDFKEAFENLQETGISLTVPIHCNECSCYCDGVSVMTVNDFHFED